MVVPGKELTQNQKCTFFVEWFVCKKPKIIIEQVLMYAEPDSDRKSQTEEPCQDIASVLAHPPFHVRLIFFALYVCYFWFSKSALNG